MSHSCHILDIGKHEHIYTRTCLLCLRCCIDYTVLVKIKLKYFQRPFQYHRHKKLHLGMPDHLASLHLFTRKLICNFNHNVPNTDILCEEWALTLIFVHWPERVTCKPVCPKNIVLNCGIIFGNTTPRSNTPFNIWTDLQCIVKLFSVFCSNKFFYKVRNEQKARSSFQRQLKQSHGCFEARTKPVTSPRIRVVPREIQSSPARVHLPADGPVRQPTHLPSSSRRVLFVYRMEIASHWNLLRLISLISCLTFDTRQAETRCSFKRKKR